MPARAAYAASAPPAFPRWDRELGRAKMFRHRNRHPHPSRLETLRRVERFVFNPKIDITAEFALPAAAAFRLP